ncbi:Uu.00g013550.m01.CDS01 [Anthostomella pinea]|uniref:Uu.00g013550.m01.CDS01 n=1 Tax=Anthostomella pinea TaxID=933095 RepID=A0AAI8YQD1_9PEZI|nr:Uu.00g013550.m01.CDS01 [Anthostomella pinea]
MAVARIIVDLQKALPPTHITVTPSAVVNGIPTSGCIVYPRTSYDVSVFLQVMTPYVLDGKVTFTIRDGGRPLHPDQEEFKNDVIVLDLSYIREIHLITPRIASIGAGERWGAVYEKLRLAGVNVVGARNPGRGIGNLALQGGLSFLSSSIGFVSDNVVSYDVVLASGDIVRANAQENPLELMPFTTVQPQIKELTYLGYVHLGAAAAEPGGLGSTSRRAHLDTTVKADAATLTAATDIFTSALDPVKALNDLSLIVSIVFEPLPISLIQVSITKSYNPFGLDSSAGPLVSISLVLT